MTVARGRKSRVNHQAIVEYAKANPSMLQVDIARQFGTTQCWVCRILRAAGVTTPYRGRAIKRKPGQSEEEYEWEQKLHDAGLGMDRGLRLNRQRIFYGYDPAKEDMRDSSATSNGNF